MPSDRFGSSRFCLRAFLYCKKDLFFQSHGYLGRIPPAMVDGIMGNCGIRAVIAAFCVAVWEYEILCAGSNGNPDFMAFFEAVGNLGGPDF